jgi:predicted phage baseplate assembly protein
VLDAEAGTIRFGDGVRGRIPDAGCRVRIERMRYGGGRAGNLPAGALSKIEPNGQAVPTKLKVEQRLTTDGGADAETFVQAERRIPSLFRDGDRAVTAEDFRRIAIDTPGLRMGRVEIMPRFKPQQRMNNVPGVVTVMTLPYKDGFAAPAPRPDRPFLEGVHSYMDVRRLLTTELYTIGCEYVSLGVGVAVSLRDGYGRDAVLHAVRDALQHFLWPLAPGGHDNNGWTLGRAVTNRELEVCVARVPGVDQVNGVSIFRERAGSWERIQPTRADLPATLYLEKWQLPELLSVVVVDSLDMPEDLSGVPNPFADETGIPVPVVPEVC